MNQYIKLGLSILLDAIGYVSFIIPGVGEFFDIVWAPVSAWIMTKMYKGRPGRIAAAISFIEEAMPGLDVIPTFTIMWFYNYFFNKKKVEVIEIK